MSKVILSFCLSLVAVIAFADKLPDVSVTVINCESTKTEITFSLPEFGSCKEQSTVKLNSGEKHNCVFTPDEVKPYAIQAYAPTGSLTLLPIMYHAFCIGVAKADFGFQYVPCDEDCLATATDYYNPYKSLKNK